MALILNLTDNERLQNLRTNLKLARDYLMDAHTEAKALDNKAPSDAAVSILTAVEEVDQLRARL
jgi:hypothetical protein